MMVDIPLEFADQWEVESRRGKYGDEYEKKRYEPLTSHKTGAKLRFSERKTKFIWVFPNVSNLREANGTNKWAQYKVKLCFNFYCRAWRGSTQIF